MVRDENVCLRSDLKRKFDCGGRGRRSGGAVPGRTLLGAAAHVAPQENQETSTGFKRSGLEAANWSQCLGGAMFGQTQLVPSSPWKLPVWVGREQQRSPTSKHPA